MRVYTSVSPLQKHVVLFGGSLAWGHLNIADQRVCFCLAASQVFFFFSSSPPSRTQSHRHAQNITHTSSLPSLFFGRRRRMREWGWGWGAALICSLITQRPLRQPNWRSLARSLCCWSFLLVTSAPSTRSPQCRSSGISPMENLLGILKKPAHTCNCDGVVRLSLTAPFFSPLPPSAQSLDEKLFHLCSVIS